jgi:hypothetical protein
MKGIDSQSGRFLGFVQLQVGSRFFALPVQAIRLQRPDGSMAPSGFVTEGSQFGIVVDGDASDTDVQAQIRRASKDAVRHISRKFLN